MQKFFKKNILYILWIQTIAASVGSLFYSEIKHFSPCTLCWYQRIFMFPLVLIIAVGILRKDKKLYLYVLPLSILGLLIAFYQILLQNGILPETTVPCVLGVSCKTGYTNYFGFITIPVMSFLAFSTITAGMIYYKRIQKAL